MYIYEINMEKYKELWQSKNEKEINHSKYLIMLDLETEDLKKLSKKNKKLTKKIKKLTKKNKKLKKDLKKAQKLNKEILNSTSWKLTGVFRKPKTVLKKFRD